MIRYLAIVALAGCLNTGDFGVPAIGEVHHCWFFDGIGTTTDNECLTPDLARTRVLTFQNECEAMHAIGWYCGAECKADAFPDLCIVPGSGGGQ